LAISIPRDADPDTGSNADRRMPSWRAMVFVVGASLFVILVSVFAASRSALFALRRVEVHGIAHRSAAEVVTRANVPTGTNIVWLDTGAVARRLESDPWIARATVTRSLPGTLEISVAERHPIAILRDGSAETLVAADGAWLGAAPTRARLPAIRLPPAAPATIGAPGEAGAVRALAALTPSVRHRIREIDVALGGTLTAVVRGGPVVELGPAVDLDAKARVLRRVLSWERTTGSDLATVTVVAPAAPAARLEA
jgi:cell division protein FtsQ